METLKLTEKGNSYWNDNGAYQKEYVELYEKLVPSSGEAETLHGELLRSASRLMYEYYNNGNCNAKEYLNEYSNDYDEDDDEDIAINSFYYQFLKNLNTIPNTDKEIGMISRLILADHSYIDSDKNMSYEWLMDKTIHYILTTEDKPIPEEFKFKEEE